jgi:hypothetical protein
VIAIPAQYYPPDFKELLFAQASFNIFPLSVGQIVRVELVAHTLMLSVPAEAF